MVRTKRGLTSCGSPLFVIKYGADIIKNFKGESRKNEN